MLQKLATPLQNNLQQNEQANAQYFSFCMLDIMRDIAVAPLHMTCHDWLQL